MKHEIICSYNDSFLLYDRKIKDLLIEGEIKDIAWALLNNFGIKLIKNKWHMCIISPSRLFIESVASYNDVSYIQELGWDSRYFTDNFAITKTKPDFFVSLNEEYKNVYKKYIKMNLFI